MNNDLRNIILVVIIITYFLINVEGYPSFFSHLSYLREWRSWAAIILTPFLKASKSSLSLGFVVVLSKDDKVGAKVSINNWTNIIKK
jgi:hypothetical protein